MNEDWRPRRTSTPLRRRRRPRVIHFLVLTGVIAAVAFGARQALSTPSRGATSGDGACAAVSCSSIAAQIPGEKTAEPTPCAYCGQDDQRWRQSTIVGPPEIAGRSAVVIEASCGTMVYGVNENERLPPASLTKIVTAMVTMEQAHLADMVDIKFNGWDLASEDGSSIMGLEAGMRLSVQDLLYGLLLASGNDAAQALADYVGGEQHFVDLMNAKVGRLGLQNTHFVNPDGRDATGHYSTTLDMALLGRALLQDPTLNKIVNTKTYQPSWEGPAISNGNEMIWAYADAVGVKIGYTEVANHTIVTGIQRDGRLLIAAVFGAWHAYIDPVHLLNWAFANTKPLCPSPS